MVPLLPRVPLRSFYRCVVAVYIGSSLVLIVAGVKTCPCVTPPLPTRNDRRGSRGGTRGRWEGRAVKTHLPSCPFPSLGLPLFPFPLASLHRATPADMYAPLHPAARGTEEPTFLQDDTPESSARGGSYKIHVPPREPCPSSPRVLSRAYTCLRIRT